MQKSFLSWGFGTNNLKILIKIRLCGLCEFLCLLCVKHNNYWIVSLINKH